MRRVGAAIARSKNTEVAKRVAAKAVETKAPAEAVDRTARSRQGTPAKPQPFTQFKISRGTRVVVHGRLDGAQVLAALEAAVEMARAELEQAEEEQGEQEEWEPDPDGTEN